METFVGVDYHKAFSYATIMDEKGHILKQGQFANRPEALTAFLGQSSILICLLPLTPRTDGILNRESFSALPPGAYPPSQAQCLFC